MEPRVRRLKGEDDEPKARKQEVERMKCKKCSETVSGKNDCDGCKFEHMEEPDACQDCFEAEVTTLRRNYQPM